jgi:hypothetical protein
MTDPEAFGGYLANHLEFFDPQHTFEEALLTARERPCETDGLARSRRRRGGRAD